jgi:DNA-binding NarL/FixJ family response regulator
MDNIKIILVDDHTLFTEGLVAALSKDKEIEVIATFSDAREALKALKLKLPDLLITDISMPNMNGVEFIQKLNERYPKLKILVSSMYQQMVSSKNIHGYLQKDTTTFEFLNAIKKIVLEDKHYFKEIVHKNNISEFNKSILTKREKEVVSLISKEFTVHQIAEELFISKLTVESHKKNIFLKLQVNTNAGLVKKALMLGFLD